MKVEESNIVSVYMLWFNFILGLNFISLCFKLIIIHYHTPKQRKIKFKPRIKLNHNMSGFANFIDEWSHCDFCFTNFGVI